LAIFAAGLGIGTAIGLTDEARITLAAALAGAGVGLALLMRRYMTHRGRQPPSSE
jgi:hypothetical protein